MNAEEYVIERLNKLIARQNNAYIRWLDNSKKTEKERQAKAVTEINLKEAKPIL